MHWTTLRTSALLACLMVVTAATPALPNEDGYIQFKASALLDDSCGVFRFTEREILSALSGEAVRDTGQYAKLVEAVGDYDAFGAWVDELDAKAAALAQSVGCTQAANQILGPVRGAVAGRLYQDLLLAVHFHNPSQDAFERIELSPTELAAANAFDAYLQQLYGQSFGAFATAHKEAVSRIVLPPVNNDPGSFLFAPLSMEDMESRRAALEPLQSRARGVIADALLEVSAETSGFRLRPEAGGNALVLVPQQAPEQRLVVIDTGHRFSTDEKLGPWMSGILVRMPDRKLRLMSFGGEGRFETANAVLLVAPGPSRSAGGTAPILGDPEWRAEALSFAGVPVGDGCLKARCLEFPAEAHDAILATDRMDYAELWVSATGATEPPVGPVEGFQNRILAASLQDFVNGAPE